jgi:sulfonate transport system substrate-binding protein
MKRRSFLGLAAAGALASACGQSGGAGGAARTIRIGYQKNGTFLVASQRETVADAVRAAGGAGVEWREFQAGPPLLEAMAAGAIDLGGTGDAPPIFAQAAGAPIRYVAVRPLSGAAGGLLTPKGSAVKSLADLKGRKLAFARGSSGHNTAIVALASVGLTLADVGPVNLGPADAAAAFAQGGIDGWVIWDPFYTAAIRDQGARVLISGDKLGGGAGYVLASAKAVEEAPALVSAALDGLKADGDWATANRAEVAALMARETGLAADLMADTVQRDDFVLQPITADIVAGQQVIADRFAAEKIIPAPVRIADAVWAGWEGA